MAGTNVTWTNGAAFTLAQGSVTAGTVSASGAITNSAALTVTTANFIVGASGLTLSGGGQFAFSNLASNSISGATAAATFTDVDNLISGAGALGGGKMTLAIKAAAIINGNGSRALTIDTGANTVANAGLIEATGAGGVNIQSAINNNGVLAAMGGVLTVNGNVSGIGAATINGGVLDFTQAFNQNVTFTGGATGVLELTQSQSYRKSITGLSQSGANALDLVDVGFVGAGAATYVDNGLGTGGVLTVSDGVHTSRITLVGAYTTANFVCASDGQGGVLVTDPTKSRSAQSPDGASALSTLSFIAAMANSIPASGAEVAHAHAPVAQPDASISLALPRS